MVINPQPCDPLMPLFMAGPDCSQPATRVLPSYVTCCLTCPYTSHVISQIEDFIISSPYVIYLHQADFGQPLTISGALISKESRVLFFPSRPYLL